MSGDVLPELLQIVRDELGSAADPRVIAAIEARIRANYGAEQHYIARRPKGALLERLDSLDAAQNATSTAEMARLLGITPRHLQRLQAMRRRGT